MAYGKISDKQREILEYIKKEILNKGYPPTVRDICEAVQLKSTSSVHSHLETLEKNGYIRRDPTKPRAIEIVDDNFNLTRREVVNVPMIGQVAAGQRLHEFFDLVVGQVAAQQNDAFALLFGVEHEGAGGDEDRQDEDVHAVVR